MEKRKQGRPFKKDSNKLKTTFLLGLYEKDRENLDLLIDLNYNISQILREYLNDFAVEVKAGRDEKVS